jgi:hypothetical protein
MNSKDGLLTTSPVRTCICGANIPEKEKSLLITGFNLCTQNPFSNLSQLLMNQSINYYLQEN